MAYGEIDETVRELAYSGVRASHLKAKGLSAAFIPRREILPPSARLIFIARLAALGLASLQLYWRR